MSFFEYEDRDVIFEVLGLLFADCGRKEIPDLVLKHWHLNLRKYSDEQIVYGYQQASQTQEKWQPELGKFIDLMITPPGCESLEQEAKEAWDIIKSLISRVGPYRSLYFKNTIISESIRKTGGWIKLCRENIEDLVWKEKDFIQFYKMFKKRCEVYDPYLPGITDSQNRPYIIQGEAKREIVFQGDFSAEEKQAIIQGLDKSLLTENKVFGLLAGVTNAS